MKKSLLFLTTLTIIIGGLLPGCQKPNGPEDGQNHNTITISSGVTGVISFTGDWPAKAAEVRLVTSKVFPPEMSDVIFGDSIPMDTASYFYQFALEPGSYKFVGVAWRNEGAEWNFPSLCSFYFSSEDSLAPLTITIPDNSTIIPNVNMKVNRSKARIVSDAKITGSVTFVGDWPPEFTQARVIATTRFDINTMDLPTLNDVTFSKSISRGTKECEYEIPSFPGNFRATFVLFFKEGEKISVDNVLYSSDHGGLDMTTTYTVNLDETVKGPDFTIEF